MIKSLVLAEKPSVGRDIARVLNCNKKGNGYFEGDKYIVTWALGHLVTLADPEAYGDKYKAWRLEDLPMLPPSLKLVVIKQSGKQFNTVKDLMHKGEVREIIIATDAGREGELVARWIIDKAKVKKPLKRLWISSVTDKAINEGFNNLKAGQQYENLFASAEARAEADWLVGINATRALTCKYNAQLSCGRVQTPTVAIIAKREEEIRSFQPQTYYGLTAVAEGLKLFWQEGQSRDYRTFDKAKTENLLLKLKGEKAVITEINKTLKKSFAPQLYDLTELQRDANRIFAYSAKETLSIMQKLYENHKVLTYPRTDSKYISNDIVDTLKDRIKACSQGPFAKLGARIARSPVQVNKHFVDDSKVTDHHAIIPTEQSVPLSSFTDKERKIYELVVKRFLAVLSPPFEYEQTTIQARIAGEVFIAKGKTIISQGWKEVYDNQFEEDEKEELLEQVLPRLTEKAKLDILELKQTQGQTKPPTPFNEGTLLKAMENPVKYLAKEAKDLIKTLGETGGIGTVATRADIIEKLFNSFIIEKRGKDIFVTSKGKQLLELVPTDLRSPALTAEWEQKLAAIAKGKHSKEKFISEMRAYTQEIVGQIKNALGTFKHDNLTRNRCPECGKYMLEVNGKKGKMLVCEDRECGHRKKTSLLTNARCPECHKKLELRGEGEGQVFACKCGYREKMSAFKDRKQKGNNKVSKKEVSKYLKEQKQAEDKPINSALADALAKLKL